MEQHIMELSPLPFHMIKSGKKTIELRLYDEKRKKIHIGDLIKFSNRDNPAEALTVRVVNLFVFDSFETLYKELPLTECGYTEETVKTALPKDMDMYYTKEQQEKCGVIGIQIALI